MFKHSKLFHYTRSSTNKSKKTFKNLMIGIYKKLTSISVRLFVILVIMICIPTGIVYGATHYYYRQSMVNNEVAKIQTKAAVMVGDFSQYSSLSEAEKAGVYNNMVQYSELNSVRIRIINVNFVVVSDSYSMETGKSLINSNALSTYKTGKSLSGYDKETGTIEATVPILNVTNQVIGVFLMDMDISEITTFSTTVMERTNTVIISLLTVMAGLSIAVAKAFRNPFQQTFRTVEEIANGHTNKRIRVNGYSELKQFANDFNTIMDQTNAMDQSRQEFVSNVSHELKTPITSIKVLADSLNMQEDVPIELYQEFMKDIATEIDRESKIIEDLLSLVRLDQAAAVLNISSVNLNELLEIVLKRLKPIAQKKNVEVLFESFRPVVAEIDEVKFTQVISNLVENAIKYNRPEGWVHVSLNADYQYFYIRVEDSGIGIPKENQNMVFERFYRVDKARSRETGGTGLGLAIVRNIIIMHHGTIKLHSEEGVGTTFTVRIPLNYLQQEDQP